MRADEKSTVPFAAERTDKPGDEDDDWDGLPPMLKAEDDEDEDGEREVNEKGEEECEWGAGGAIVDWYKTEEAKLAEAAAKEEARK